MATTSAVFFKEVLDTIARNPPAIADLFVLRDLCEAVEAGDRAAVARLTRELTGLDGVEDPLHAISYELFHAVLTRLLLNGWFDEFDLLINWQQTWFGSKDERVASNWEGVIKIVSEKPRSVGLLVASNREEEWRRASNGLHGAIRHFVKVRLPTQSYGAPPEPIPFHERILPERLGEATELFFRMLQILFQQMLERALARLERDPNDTSALRRLQTLHDSLVPMLTAKDEQQKDTLERVLQRRIRVVEVRYGRGTATLHRFLDAFPPHDARSVIFNSLDRDDKQRPFVRGDKLENIFKARTRQLGFYFNAYGHPSDPNERPGEWFMRRRAVIKSKHAGHLKLVDNDDFVALLSHFFDDALAEIMRRATTLSKDEAGVLAWRATVEMYSQCLGHLTSHSRLNLTEGPPNYLTHSFPRNIVGRLLHDCGVYAVRSAYTLLTVLDRIAVSQGRIAGTVRARWVRVPLHVGLVIESTKLGLLVQHNDHLFALDKDDLAAVRSEWLAHRPTGETDPFGPLEETLKFYEDIAASAFSSDLDMPVTSVPVLNDGEPVTVQTIWNSYQKKVVPSQLFTGVVGARNAPQYQFDVRYLRLSEIEREWYNRTVVPFWNDVCNIVWRRSKDALIAASKRADQAALAKAKQAYIAPLRQAIDLLIGSYDKEILPGKKSLSEDLRADKGLLLPGVRIVSAVRIGTVLPAVRKVMDHIKEVSDPSFTFADGFAPPFAKAEEELFEVP